MSSQPSVTQGRLARALSLRIGCGALFTALFVAVVAGFIWDKLVVPVFFIVLVLYWIGAVFTTSPNTGRCPYCRKMISFEATVCPRCGRDLPTEVDVVQAGTAEESSTAPATSPDVPTSGPAALPVVDTSGYPQAVFPDASPALEENPPPRWDTPQAHDFPSGTHEDTFCMRCGSNLPADAVYCGRCGTQRGST